MSHIDQTVGNERMIGIADRDQDAACIFSRSRIIVKGIRQFAEQDAGYLLFQQPVGTDLKIFVDRKIHVISGLWIRRTDRLGHFAKIIHIVDRFAFLSLKCTVVYLLDPPFSYNI